MIVVIIGIIGVWRYAVVVVVVVTATAFEIVNMNFS